jgi:hypothetical protein
LSPNKLHRRLCQELSRQRSEHRVLLVFDPGQQLCSLLNDVATSQPNGGEAGVLNLGEQQPQWVVAGSSLYELRSQIEPLVANDLPDPLLVYLPEGTVFSSDGKALVRALDAKCKPTCRPMAGVDVLRRANQQREIDWSGLPAAGATLADLNPAERDRLRVAVKQHKGEESLLELGDEELDLALGLVT